jgi:hypothetical protein
MHFIGLAYYDRTIITEKTGKKNIVTKKDITVNKVTEESRKIKFRDDNMALDSGSRFADIVEEIPLDSDAMITALTDAIKAEFEKRDIDKTLTETAKEQEAENEKKIQKNIEKLQTQKKVINEEDEFSDLKEKIMEFIKTNKNDNPSILKPVLKAMRNYGYKNPSVIETLEHAKEIAELIED